MPFRRWFTEHGMPSWYSWAVVVGGAIMANVLTLIIAVNLANNAVREERKLRLEADERARHTACQVIEAQNAAYSDPDAMPVTQAGKNAAAAWQQLHLDFRCNEK